MLTMPAASLSVQNQMVHNEPKLAGPEPAPREKTLREKTPGANPPRGPRRKEFFTIGALFVIALLLNLFLLWLHYNPDRKILIGDENYNYAVARALAEGEEFLPDPAWPPLYVDSLALLLSGDDSGYGLVQAAQIVMWLFAAFFFYRIALRLLPWRRAALAGLVLILFSPELIAFSHYLWPEIPHLFFFLAALWLLVCHGHRTGAVVAAGIFVGLGLLTKLLVMPFVPVLVVCVVIFNGESLLSRTLRGAVFALGLFVTVLPTMLANLDAHGRFMIADSSVFNLWVGLNDTSTVDYKNDITEREYREFRRSAKNITAQNALYREKVGRLVDERGLAGTLWGQLSKQYFRLFGCRTFFTTQLPGGPRHAYRFDSPALTAGLRLWSFAMHALLVAACGVGICLIRWRPAGWAHCVLLFVVYNLALFLFLHAKTRYFIQIVPMLALFAGAAVEFLLRRISGASLECPRPFIVNAPRVACGLVLALLLLFLSFRSLF